MNGSPEAESPIGLMASLAASGAFSSEVDTGSRQENASKLESRAFSVLIPSEPKWL
jgi:hypothetical protein